MTEKTKKHTLHALFMLLICLSLSACGCEHNYDSGTVTKEATCTEEGIKSFKCTLCGNLKEESIPCTEHNYEKKVTEEATFDKPGKITYTCTICGNSYSEDIPVKERTVAVTVTNKTNVPKDIYNGRYSNRAEFTFDVKNESDKAVKGVQGVLIIKDLFEKDILSMNCDFTGQTIPANSSINVTNIGMDINEFMDNHTKLYNESFSDLKFDYKISNIVYADEAPGTMDLQSENNLVDIKVINKENLPKDIHNGRYSARVQLTIEAKNKTDKDIKGISGVIKVKDLFGKDIISSNCDFTGQVIPAGSSKTYTNLGMDINEFMDEHVKFYNEKYDDLNFVYTIKSIIYADGTSETFNQ